MMPCSLKLLLAVAIPLQEESSNRKPLAEVILEITKLSKGILVYSKAKFTYKAKTEL